MAEKHGQGLPTAQQTASRELSPPPQFIPIAEGRSCLAIARRKGKSINKFFLGKKKVNGPSICQ
jgi:hypothetical protein